MRALQQQALEAFRALNDSTMLARTLHNLGHVLSCQGEHAPARSIFAESLGLFRALRDPRGTAYATTNLGVVAAHQGDLAAARRFLHESLTILRDLGEQRAICRALEGCGLLAAARGDGVRAARLLGAALAGREAIGMPICVNDRSHYEYNRYTALARAAAGDDAFEAAWAHGRTMTLGGAIDDARGGAIEADGSSDSDGNRRRRTTRSEPAESTRTHAPPT